MKCKNCKYCEMTGRADIMFAGPGRGCYGRGKFFCKHPGISMMPLKVFGNRAVGFINFGTMEQNSVVNTKTHPRWCPLRGEKKRVK